MGRFSEEEQNIIKYSLKFLHNRDLYLFYDKEFISTLENTMHKFGIEFTPQEEIDKKKIKKYIVIYEEEKKEIFLNESDKQLSSDILEDTIARVIKKYNLSSANFKILMNKNTFDYLSKIFTTMPYVMGLFYYPVNIDESTGNGEIKITK